MDHVELINRIIEAERQAQRMAEEARQKQGRLHEDLKQDAAAMRQNYLAQAKTRVEHVREREIKAADEKLDALESLSSIEIQAMRDLYAQHQEEWADTIFQIIIGDRQPFEPQNHGNT